MVYKDTWRPWLNTDGQAVAPYIAGYPQEPTLCSSCVCDTCPPLQDREDWNIIYFDKNATGDDDGTSWTNAIEDISKVKNYPKYRCLIKGHGSADKYEVNGYELDFDDDNYFYLKASGVDDLYFNFKLSNMTCSYLDGIHIDAFTPDSAGSAIDYIAFTSINYSIVVDCRSDNNRGGFSGAEYSTFTDCYANDSTHYGGAGFGIGNTLIRFTANNNVGSGLSTSTGSSLEDCVADDNTVNGISAWNCTLVDNCSADDNGEAGFRGLGYSILIDCTAEDNGKYGFLTADGATFIDCYAGSDDQYSAFQSLENCTFIDCIAEGGNFYGCYVLCDGSSFDNCTADKVTGGNEIPSGFASCADSDFDNCSATNAKKVGTGIGFHSNNDSTFDVCDATNNSDCGFRSNSGGVFTLCTQSGNGNIGVPPCDV